MQQPYNLKSFDPKCEELVVQPGDFDGLTIMRYAHVYRGRTSGGVEQYLRRLHQGLLERHRMTILQMHLVTGESSCTIEIENVGLGRIMWVPVPFRQISVTLPNLPKRIVYIYGQTLRACRQEGARRFEAISFSIKTLWRHFLGHLRHESIILSDHLPRMLAKYNVDLLSVHWATYDAQAVVSRAMEAKVPFVFINHFDNIRLSQSRRPTWLACAAQIGSVSGQRIPGDLLDRYAKLLDAVDTDFFDPSLVKAQQYSTEPLVLLPARITPGKGHHDLIEAARILASKHSKFILCFVGAVDSEPLHQDLLRSIQTLGLRDRILFLGETSLEGMRDLYARSSVVVLPSYSEGLPRVLLEAQAMRKPIVAYDSGGTPEAVLPNETGFLVRTGDVEALAERVGLLLQDGAARLRLGERGREFVIQKFSVSALIQRHEAFYLKALARGGDKNVKYNASGTASRVSIAKPLVSILVPAYNAEQYIAQTLRSALAQTWPRKEIIVVDDGSTDQTVTIARQFESRSVRVITQDNQGAAAARNKAFSLSNGEYIQWLDADDLLAPDKISKQLEATRECGGNRGLLSSAWGLFMYRHYRAQFVPTALWNDLPPVEWLLRKMGENLYMQTASWLVSRELSAAAGPWDTRLLGDDDGEYFCRILLASDGVKFVPGAKVFYRGPALAFRSLSYIGRSFRKLDAHWLSMRLHIGYLLSLEDSTRVRTACLRYLQASLIYFFPERQDIVAEAEKLAGELGGTLKNPQLSWKYSWMETAFGWTLAKRGQQWMLKSRWYSEKFWDKMLYQAKNAVFPCKTE